MRDEKVGDEAIWKPKSHRTKNCHNTFRFLQDFYTDNWILIRSLSLWRVVSAFYSEEVINWICWNYNFEELRVVFHSRWVVSFIQFEWMLKVSPQFAQLWSLQTSWARFHQVNIILHIFVSDETDWVCSSGSHLLTGVDSGRPRSVSGSSGATDLPRSVQRAAKLARLESADYQLFVDWRRLAQLRRISERSFVVKIIYKNDSYIFIYLII